MQYGPRIIAIILNLYIGQSLSKARTAQALGELFGTPISEGTVAAMTTGAAESLDGFCHVVADRIAASPVAGFYGKHFLEVLVTLAEGRPGYPQLNKADQLLPIEAFRVAVGDIV